MTSEGDRVSTSPATLYTPLEQGSHAADEEPEQELTSEEAPTVPDEADSTPDPDVLSPEDEKREELERRMRQVTDLDEWMWWCELYLCQFVGTRRDFVT